MKCFKCGSKCITDYIKQDYDSDKIIAIQKACTVCDWRSHPVVIPESI